MPVSGESTSASSATRAGNPGPSGVILELDLASGSTRMVGAPEPAPDALSYGGSFLGLAVLVADRRALGAVVAPSVLCGTPLEPLARTAVVGMSRAFPGAADPQAGGRFGGALRACGVEALVVRGRAASPVFAVVSVSGSEGVRVRLEDAAGFWGMDVPASHAALSARGFDLVGGAGLDASTLSTLVIGPAGEEENPWANVTLDGAHRCNRGGLGAAFGGARLKGIVVVASGRPPVSGRLPEGWPWLYADLSREGGPSPEPGRGPCPGCMAACGRDVHPADLGPDAEYCNRMGLDVFSMRRPGSRGWVRLPRTPEESAVDGLAVCRFGFEPYERGIFSLESLARMVSDVTGLPTSRSDLVGMGARRIAMLRELLATA